MAVVAVESPDVRYLNRLLSSRYMAARASAYHARVAVSDSYILYSARNMAPAFKKGNNVSVTDGPLMIRELSCGVTRGIRANIAPNAKAKNMVVGRWADE